MKLKLKYNGLLFFFLASTMLSLLQAQANFDNSEHGTLIRAFLDSDKSRYGLEETDFANLIINNQYNSESTAITHVYINQTYQGIRIFNAISSVAIKDAKVFYYANRFVANISTKVNATSPSYSPQASIQKVADEFTLGPLQSMEQIEVEGYRYTFSNAGISSSNIPVELVYVKVENSLRLAWDITVYKTDNSNWWSVRVDALTGEVIDAKDLILTCKFHKEEEHTAEDHPSESNISFIEAQGLSSAVIVDGSSYNVYPLPIESPNHGSRQIVTDPADLVASPFGWHDTDGIVGPEFTITRGNNVLAKEDADGLNETGGLGFSPEGTAVLSFDFPLDFNLAPVDYQEAAITNLFYMNNMMHDIWFNHGFNEAAGNFQATNYSNFGLSDDFVVADAQDGSGFNNANFGTPSDGFNPRMQMFLWRPPGGSSADQVEVLNGSVAGSYNGVGAGFGTQLTSSSPITGILKLASNGPGDTYQLCQPLANPTILNNSIAVIRRGNCQFGTKVLEAQNSGAIAAIVVNNVPDVPIVMGPGDLGNLVTIPSIMVRQNIGEALILALENGENITTTLLGPDLTDFIDGDFDNVIIAHEYGHGISNRLAGGPRTASCLFNDEQMGEGWSDWFGLMVTMKATDLPEDGRGIGTFAVSQATNGGGIRPARYSVDFGINPATYQDSNFLSQPHGIGFVWASTLWDLTWAYIDKYGFDPDLYNGTGGNNRVMQLVIDGLKLQPCQPGFIDGRDALLAADLATTGGADQCLIWEVFAARGLGFNAFQGSSLNRADQVQDFSLPPSDNPSLVNCSTLSIEEYTKEVLRIYPNPTQTELSIKTSQNLGAVTMTLTDINGRVVLLKKTELLNRITLNLSQLTPGLYILRIQGDTINYNEKILKN